MSFASSLSNSSLYANATGSITAWQSDISKVSAGASGCYVASYPSMVWKLTKCDKPMSAPSQPAMGYESSGVASTLAEARPAANAQSATAGSPSNVGGGCALPSTPTCDWVAGTEKGGLIGELSGEVSGSGVTSETNWNGTTLYVPNYFSLQVNSELNFPVTYAGQNALGWEQFIYSNTGEDCSKPSQPGTCGAVWIEYWLFNWNGACPTQSIPGGDSSWFNFTDISTDTECTYNTAGPVIPYVAPTALDQTAKPLELIGEVNSTSDEAIFCIFGTSPCYMEEIDSSVLGLYNQWTAGEFNIFGDLNGDEAIFNPGTSLEVADNLYGPAPSFNPIPTKCLNEGFTGEANNLNIQTHISHSGCIAETTGFMYFVESLPAYKPVAIIQCVPCVNSGLSGIVFNTGGDEGFVSEANSGNVSVISSRTNSIVATIPTGTGPGLGPEGVAFDNHTNELYVPNYGSNTVSVISAATNTVVATIKAGSGPYGAVFDPNKDEIFVLEQDSDTVSVISDANNSVVQTINVGNTPQGIAYDPNTDEIFVSNFLSNNVSVISDATNSVVQTISVGAYPTGIAFDSNLNEIFVANWGANTVSVISDATNKVIHTINVGKEPEGLAFDPIKNDVFVANSGNNTVSVISDAKNKVIKTIDVGTAPYGVAFDPQHFEVYVTDEEADSVTVVSD